MTDLAYAMINNGMTAKIRSELAPLKEKFK